MIWHYHTYLHDVTLPNLPTSSDITASTYIMWSYHTYLHHVTLPNLATSCTINTPTYIMWNYYIYLYHVSLLNLPTSCYITTPTYIMWHYHTYLFHVKLQHIHTWYNITTHIYNIWHYNWQKRGEGVKCLNYSLHYLLPFKILLCSEAQRFIEYGYFLSWLLRKIPKEITGIIYEFFPPPRHF